MNGLVAKAMEIAESQKGVREVGNNAGKRVGEYLRSVGLPTGNPWCAAFVYWCIDKAADELKVHNPFVRTGACAVIDAWAQRNNISENKPEPGDVFLRRGTVHGVFRACHTGFVTEVNGTHFETWEGNTNLAGGREGIGVFHRTRGNSDRFCFVRWSELAPRIGGGDEDEEAGPEYDLFVGNSKKALCSMPVHEGRALCPVRLWGEKLGFEVEWNDEEQIFLFDGKEIVTEAVIIDGKAYAPIRDLADSAKLQLKVDAPKRRVEVARIL